MWMQAIKFQRKSKQCSSLDQIKFNSGDVKSIKSLMEMLVSSLSDGLDVKWPVIKDQLENVLWAISKITF